MRKIIILFIIVLIVSPSAENKTKVIIDADTANEVDDLYAVVRGLIEPTWEVIGLNATQWQVSHWAVEKSMEESYRLNNVLLSYLHMRDKVSSNRGAEARLFDWGNKAQPSAASNFIIREAHKANGEKLTVIALGALTNVASAILDDPSITSKINLYWLGTRYDFAEQTMSNIGFNSVMDIQAVSVILNSEVELHIMPGNVSGKMVLDWHETEDRFKGHHDLLDFLLQRWYNHLDPGRSRRSIWDLALIQAMIHPEYADKVRIKTSKEKGDREIWMYRDIDADKMREEFYTTTLEFVKGLD